MTWLNSTLTEPAMLITECIHIHICLPLWMPGCEQFELKYFVDNSPTAQPQNISEAGHTIYCHQILMRGKNEKAEWEEYHFLLCNQSDEAKETQTRPLPIC